ncbi:MAG TPA: BadF/BadG/BcrA/BcrD ATPase family protein [Gemmatimonadales bacterium]|nr:BadF/BadG/BcrA/BcrD ATPase family protein [Gemmatimonadales bacterium]
MSNLILGADVGGTKTAIVAAEDGRVLARTVGPGAKMRLGRGMASAGIIGEVARRVLAEAGRRRAEVLVVGAAGAGREAEREELRQALRTEDLAERVTVTGDIEIALAAAFEDRPGIVVTAGTGSIAVARDPFGRLHRAGGFGWQMGDEGSGYAVGRAALGAIGRAADGRSPKTALTGLVMALTHCDNLDALIRWAAAANPAEVAALAPAVFRAASEGDTVAAGILDYAARELATLVFQLLGHFGADTRSAVEVATNGGLLHHEGPLYHTFKARLAAEPRLSLQPKPVDPALGAIWLAERGADGRPARP